MVSLIFVLISSAKLLEVILLTTCIIAYSKLTQQLKKIKTHVGDIDEIVITQFGPVTISKLESFNYSLNVCYRIQIVQIQKSV